VAGAVAELERGRDFYAKRAWSDAYGSLTRADQAKPLSPKDLELLARSAYMLGRDDDYLDGLERAHHSYLESGQALRAVRCAWWIGHNFLFRGETGPARGWFARAQRLLDGEQRDCVERGYVLIAALLEQIFGGDHNAAHATAVEITEIGERFGDRDLVALGLMEQGHALVRQGRSEDGLGLVDETMVAVTTGELSPIVAGIVYCNTIAFCQSVYELRRAREWTAALTRWCRQQPEMVAHNGLCLVHRAQLMTLAGKWEDALDELHRLGKRFTEGVLNQRALGLAAYQRAELHRLWGQAALAEAAYKEASRLGREPQPGLALLRLAQGRADAAAAAIRRAMSETIKPLERAALLPAYVEIMVAVGDVEAARVSCRELTGIAERQRTGMLHAMAAHARGEVALAETDGRAALVALRRACQAWQELDAPHEGARARALVGLACRALGDDDTAALELEAARSVFTGLRAGPGLSWIDSLTGRGTAPAEHGLTTRELQVLRLVADGKSNREIASALVISERTVARHMQNIFAKLRVSSRTAASKFAFEQDLV
jgi:DNA-binding CsgD family transcriptional regulator/tetratricopeptide (TPR) repeat protein